MKVQQIFFLSPPHPPASQATSPVGRGEILAKLLGYQDDQQLYCGLTSYASALIVADCERRRHIYQTTNTPSTFEKVMTVMPARLNGL